MYRGEQAHRLFHRTLFQLTASQWLPPPPLFSLALACSAAEPHAYTAPTCFGKPGTTKWGVIFEVVKYRGIYLALAAAVLAPRMPCVFGARLVTHALNRLTAVWVLLEQAWNVSREAVLLHHRVKLSACVYGVLVLFGL